MKALRLMLVRARSIPAKQPSRWSGSRSRCLHLSPFASSQKTSSVPLRPTRSPSHAAPSPQGAGAPDAHWGDAFRLAVKAAAANGTDRAVREALDLRERMIFLGIPRDSALYARLIEAVGEPKGKRPDTPQRRWARAANIFEARAGAVPGGGGPKQAEHPPPPRAQARAAAMPR